jgi:hypothetical protein
MFSRRKQTRIRAIANTHCQLYAMMVVLLLICSMSAPALARCQLHGVRRHHLQQQSLQSALAQGCTAVKQLRART